MGVQNNAFELLGVDPRKPAQKVVVGFPPTKYFALLKIVCKPKFWGRVSTTALLGLLLLLLLLLLYSCGLVV